MCRRRRPFGGGDSGDQDEDFIVPGGNDGDSGSTGGGGGGDWGSDGEEAGDSFGDIASALWLWRALCVCSVLQVCPCAARHACTISMWFQICIGTALATIALQLAGMCGFKQQANQLCRYCVMMLMLHNIHNVGRLCNAQHGLSWQNVSKAVDLRQYGQGEI